MENEKQTKEQNETQAVKIWNKVLKSSFKLPGTRINRKDFLIKELSKKCKLTQVEEAIESRPTEAKINSDINDSIANSCIKWHTVQVTRNSFLAGLPGGWWMAGAVPADLAQFYHHVIILVQKLAYLYGWPDLLEDDQIDDETLLNITLFIGVMFGAKGATKALSEMAKRFSVEVIKRLPRKPLTKYAIYNISKQVAKWIGVKITKETFAKSLGKLIPIAGGFISGGITYITFKPMGYKLKKHLASLALAK